MVVFALKSRKTRHFEAQNNLIILIVRMLERITKTYLFFTSIQTFKHLSIQAFKHLSIQTVNK